MFSRSCLLRVLASGVGLALYGLNPLAVGRGGVEWNGLAAMIRKGICQSESVGLTSRYIAEFTNRQAQTRGIGKESQLQIGQD